MAKKELQKPTYWARIPAEVRYDPTIPDGAKLLYAEIDALSKKKGYCWASNARLAGWYGKSVDTISRWVAALVASDYISARVVTGDANTRYLSTTPKSTHELMSGEDAGTIRKNADSTIGKNADSTIGKNADRLSAKMPGGYPQKCRGAIRKNAESSINNTSISIQGEREAPPLPVFLDEKTKKGAIYLAAKSRYLLTTGGFYFWLENEVLKRCPKCWSLNLTAARLRRRRLNNC